MGGGVSTNASTNVDALTEAWLGYYNNTELRSDAPLKEGVTEVFIDRGLPIIKGLESVEPLANIHIDFLDHFITEINDFIRVYAVDEYQLAIKVKAVKALRDVRIFLIRKLQISPDNLTYIRISNRIDNIIVDEIRKITDRADHKQEQIQDQLYTQALTLAKDAIHNAKNGNGHEQDAIHVGRRKAIGTFENIIGGVSSFCHKSKIMSALIIIIVIGLLIIFTGSIVQHNYTKIGIFLVYIGVAGIAASITFEDLS